MRKFGMIFGAIITCFGLSIIFTPLRTYFMLGWITGCVLLCNGLSMVGSGVKKRKISFSKCIVGLITSVVGLILLGSDVSQALTQTITIYLVTGGIILTGIIECFLGFFMIKNEQKGIGTLILGVISTVVGITGLVFKQATVVVIGAVVGYHIVRIGINIFVSARDMYKPVIITTKVSQDFDARQ